MRKRTEEVDPWIYVVFRQDKVEVQLHPEKWVAVGARNLERAIRAIRRERMKLRKQAILEGGLHGKRTG